jgi:hypothetical protein
MGRVLVAQLVAALGMAPTLECQLGIESRCEDANALNEKIDPCEMAELPALEPCSYDPYGIIYRTFSWHPNVCRRW